MTRLRLSGECRSRLDLAEYLNRRGLTGAAAEVGVWRGDFSVPFLERWRGEVMFLVDPWAPLPAEEYDDPLAGRVGEADYEHVRERIAPFRRRACLERTTSRKAWRSIPDGLDFVYIDANHAYAHVLADLEGWWRKLKPGGALAGHDVYAPGHPGVTEALLHFLRKYDLTAEVIPADYNWAGVWVNAPSFYLSKP